MKNPPYMPTPPYTPVTEPVSVTGTVTKPVTGTEAVTKPVTEAVTKLVTKLVTGGVEEEGPSMIHLGQRQGSMLARAKAGEALKRRAALAQFLGALAIAFLVTWAVFSHSWVRKTIPFISVVAANVVIIVISFFTTLCYCFSKRVPFSARPRPKVPGAFSLGFAQTRIPVAASAVIQEYSFFCRAVGFRLRKLAFCFTLHYFCFGHSVSDECSHSSTSPSFAVLWGAG